MDLKTYERQGRAQYEAFAHIVSSILRSAILALPNLRLQLVTQRAKDVASLEKKLANRSLLDSQDIENEIKDLAGCRAVFYTNSDVSSFLRTRVVRENFDIIEVKEHQPPRRVGDETELYISVHYLVALNPARAGLVEYARFAGMRCEIQIQTILNHSWAEMAHDTIYKAPALASGFGSHGFEKIKESLGKIMAKYLVPAGYEFDKLVHDFEKLKRARETFDADPLEAIWGATDQEGRLAGLAALAEVLPYYDDLAPSWPEITNALVEAFLSALKQPGVLPEDGHRSYRNATATGVLKSVIELLTPYRYLDAERTLNATISMYDNCFDEEQREAIRSFGALLAKPQLHVFQQVGPAIQIQLVDRIQGLPPEDRDRRWPLLVDILKACLGSEIEGTSGASDSVTLHRGVVPVSEHLQGMRKKAISLLRDQFFRQDSETDQRKILAALREAERTPHGLALPEALSEMVAEDTSEILEVTLAAVPAMTMLLKQETEDHVLRLFRTYSSLREGATDGGRLKNLFAGIVEKARRFRRLVNADPDYAIFNTLVGFHSVFPPAWDRRDFGVDEAREYRKAQVEKLLAEVSTETADRWFRLITICSQVRSIDMAMFPTFHDFLTRIGKQHSAIVRSFIERMGPELAEFMPAMICGLLDAGDPTSGELIEGWISDGEHLSSILIALGATAQPPDEGLVQRATEAAAALQNADAILQALRSSSRLFDKSPDRYLETCFRPALLALLERGDMSWLHRRGPSWLNNQAMKALDVDTAKRVIRSMLPVQRLEQAPEYVLATLAATLPNEVLELLTDRLRFATGPDNLRPTDYQAFPHSLYVLGKPLRDNALEMLRAARGWYDLDRAVFSYRGGQFVSIVFAGHESELILTLEQAFLKSDNRSDIEFGILLLSSLKGKGDTSGAIKALVARLPIDDPLLPDLRRVLVSSGIVSGEYGFADLYASRKQAIEPWLRDPSENVRAFAAEFIRSISNDIAEEQGRARASIAARKLAYDEAIDDLFSLVSEPGGAAPE